MVMRNQSTIWILGSGGLIGASYSRKIEQWPVRQIRLRHSHVSEPSIHETAVGLDVYLDVDSRNHLNWISRKARLPAPSRVLLLGWGNVRDPNHESHTSISPHSVSQMSEISISLGSRRVIFAGSIDEYSGSAGRRHEDSELPEPMNSYVAGKIQAHGALDKLCKAHKVQYVHCRISSVYGPDKVKVDGSLIHHLWQTHLLGSQVALGPCLVWRDHVYVEDVSEDLQFLTFSDSVGTFNIGFGAPTQVRTLVESLWVAFGEDLKNLRFGTNSDLTNSVDRPDWYLDIGRINALAGTRRRYNLEEGTRETSRLLNGLAGQI